MFSPNQSHITECKLNRSKKITEYDVYSSKRYSYNPVVFKYIGKGFIHSINGVIQNFPQTYYFWVKR